MNNIIILKSAEEIYRRNGFVSPSEIASTLNDPVPVTEIKEILDNNNFYEKFRNQFLKIEQEGDAGFYI